MGTVVAQLLMVGAAWGHTPLMAQLMAGYLAAAFVGLCASSLSERGVAAGTVAAIGAVGTLGYVLLAGRWTHWSPPFWLGVAMLGLIFAGSDRGWSRIRVAMILGAVAALAMVQTGNPVEIFAWTAAAAVPYLGLELMLSRQQRSTVSVEASFGLEDGLEA
jgi:hypothetical protein